MAEQLGLPLIRRSDLPFVIRSRAVRRAAKNRLAQMAEGSPALERGQGFVLGALATEEALLEQLRRRTRVTGRRCGVRVAAFAATLSGRRVHRLMDEISARIAATQEQLLCG